MTSNYLPDYIENAQDELELLVPALLRGELDRRTIVLLCDTFRQHGLCSYFLTGDPKNFFYRTMQSAGAYWYYLTTVGDDQKVTSNAKAFYDAVGGAHWDVARAIAQSSRTTPQADYEYEEDFLFVFFLMKLFFLGSSAAECRALIGQHNQVTEGEDVEHREVCEALLNRDSSRFNTALDTLLVVRRDLVEDLIERGTMPEEHWAWLRYFSSEGWALLRLAELRGLSTEVDNLHVPEALRGPSPMPFDQLAWRQPQSPYYRPT